MELADGETLAERLRRGPIPVVDALPIFKQIGGALDPIALPELPEAAFEIQDVSVNFQGIATA